jgi:hypothetical protein
VWRQFEHSNHADIPPTTPGPVTPAAPWTQHTTAGAQPLGANWDFNSSLAPDLSDPVASPRLLLLAASEVARLDDLDPAWSANATQLSRRRGRLRVVTIGSAAPPVDIASPPAIDLHPWAPLRAAAADGSVDLFAVTLGEQRVG